MGPANPHNDTAIRFREATRRIRIKQGSRLLVATITDGSDNTVDEWPREHGSTDRLVDLFAAATDADLSRTERQERYVLLRNKFEQTIADTFDAYALTVVQR